LTLPPLSYCLVPYTTRFRSVRAARGVVPGGVVAPGRADHRVGRGPRGRRAPPPVHVPARRGRRARRGHADPRDASDGGAPAATTTAGEFRPHPAAVRGRGRLPVPL